MAWWQLDWLWMGTGWVLCALGVVVTGWALLWDRARGRKRCPKCWYDMAGVPGLRCPECGWEARSERRFGRTRRRWRWAVPGVVVAAVGSAAIVAPDIRRKGWTGVLPTVAVIAMLPQAGDDAEFDPVRLRWTVNPFASELQRRVEAGALSDWQWRWALERARVFRTRRYWARGECARVGIWPPVWLRDAGIAASVRGNSDARVERQSGLSWSGTMEPWRIAEERDRPVGALAADAGELVLAVEINGGESFASLLGGPRAGYKWSGTIALPCRDVDSVQESAAPLRGARFDDAVRRAFQVQVTTMGPDASPTTTRCFFVYVDRSKSPELTGAALGVVVDFVRDGNVVRTVRFGDIIDSGFGGTQSERRSEWTPEFDTNRLSAADIGRWKLRFRGDVRESLREFDCDRYWAGEIEYPLKDVLTR